MDTNPYPKLHFWQSSDQPGVLVAGSDLRTLRLLEVGLRQAGYHVMTTARFPEALALAAHQPPAVALLDVELEEGDAFTLAEKLRELPACENILLLFLIDPNRPSNRMRAVEVGVSEIVEKPVYLKEVLWRVETLLEKAAQRGDLAAGHKGAARFSGTLSATTLLDLLQSMELAGKSGLIHCQNLRGQRGTLYISEGKAIDAEVGRLRGQDALYRLITWHDGEYRVDLIDVLRPDRIARSANELILEAARRLDEWNQLTVALPPLESILLPAAAVELHETASFEPLPAELEDVLTSFNGQRTILDVVELDEELPLDTMGRLAAVARLLSERRLVILSSPSEPRRQSLTPPPVPRLTPPQIPRLTPPPMPRMTSPPIPRLTPSPVARMTPSPVARMTPSPVARMTPSPVARMTPSPVARMTPSPVARMTPPPMPRPTSPPAARLTPPPTARLTPPPTARLTPPPTARLTPPPTARLTPPPMPTVGRTASPPAGTEVVLAAQSEAPPRSLAIEHSAPVLSPSAKPLSGLSLLPELSAEMLPIEASLSGDSQIRPGTDSAPPLTSLASSSSLTRLELPEELRGPPSDPAWRSGILYAPVRSEQQAASSPILRYLLTAVAGIGLFGLGMGLYWGFHLLTRSTPSATSPASIAMPTAAPATPTHEAVALAPPPTAHSVESPPAEVNSAPVAAAPAEVKPEAPAPVPAAQMPSAPAPAAPVPAAAAPEPPPPPPSQQIAVGEPPPAPLQPPTQANDGYEAFIGKVRSAMRRGQPSLAKRNLHQALKLRPQGPAALALQAEMAIDEGDADTAARLAKKVLQLDPALADAHIVLGMAAQVQGQGGIAKMHFKKYLELAPNGDRAKDVKVFLRAGY